MNQSIMTTYYYIRSIWAGIRMVAIEMVGVSVISIWRKP